MSGCSGRGEGKNIKMVMVINNSVTLLQKECISFLLLLHQNYHKLSSLKQYKCIISSSVGQKFDASLTEVKIKFLAELHSFWRLREESVSCFCKLLEVAYTPCPLVCLFHLQH